MLRRNLLRLRPRTQQPNPLRLRKQDLPTDIGSPPVCHPRVTHLHGTSPSRQVPCFWHITPAPQGVRAPQHPFSRQAFRPGRSP